MPIRLDERLSFIASQIKGGRVCDVGCDHGKLALYLIQTERAESVIATDISAPSLAKAVRLASENGAAHLIEARRGDGLSPIQSNEVDTVVIAGLGGDVISDILQRANKEGKDFKRFVLSPNTHAEKVRAAACECGHTIITDTQIDCSGKAYTVIATENIGPDTLTDMQLKLGKFYETDEAFKINARKEMGELEVLTSQNPSAEKLGERLCLLRKAIGEIEQ